MTPSHKNTPKGVSNYEIENKSRINMNRNSSENKIKLNNFQYGAKFQSVFLEPVKLLQ